MRHAKKLTPIIRCMFCGKLFSKDYIQEHKSACREKKHELPWWVA
jgi:DNA-directed RNA polymerase subunit N (RpoN/RPB10)